MALNVFNLAAKLTLDNKDYEKGLNESKKSASSFSSKIGSVFKVAGKAVVAFTSAVITAGSFIAGLTTKAINFGDDIDKTSQKLGLSSDAYQKWALALQMAGADVSNLQMAIRQLNTFYDDLTKGEGEAILTLQQLGIEYEDFQKMNNDEKLYAIVNALQNIEDETLKTQLAQKLFGNRIYQELLPLLNQEAGSLDDLFKKFEDLGIIMSDDSVKASAKLSDKITVLKATIKSLGSIVLSDFYEPIEMIINGLQKMATGSEDAFDEVVEGFLGIIDKLSQKLPKFISKFGDFVIKIIDGLFSGDTLSKLLTELVNALILLLNKVIELVPTLVKGVLNLVNALISALLNVNWVPIIVDLIDVLVDAIINIFLDENLILNLISLAGKIIQTVFQALPQIIVNAVDSLFEKLESFKLFEKFKRLAISFVNGFIEGINMLGQFPIDEFSIGGIKLWNATQVKLWDIPLIPFAEGTQAGKWLEDFKGSLLLAGESGAEIVAQGSHGTGVSTLEDISGAFVVGMQKYGLKEIVEQAVTAVVNAIVPAIMTNKDVVVTVNGGQGRSSDNCRFN